MEWLIVCFFAGMGAGLGTGFAGMSAAAVISPMLITFLDMNPFEAIGIALASDVLASAVSAYTYGKNKNVDLKNSRIMFGSVLVFTGVGAYISHQAGSTTVGNLSVYMSLMLGIQFLSKSFKEEKEKEFKEFTGASRIYMPLLCGALIGFICGFIGAGGGIMMLMLLTGVLGYEQKVAVGTSVFIMTFTACYGAISHFSLQGIMPDVKILASCVIFTFIFAQLGATFANKAEKKQLNRATGTVLTTLALVMLFLG